MEYSCKPQVTNLDFPKMAIYKDIITLQVSMNYRRVVLVQINEPLQNLARPALNGSDINLLIFLHVSAEETRKKVLIYHQIKPKPPSFKGYGLKLTL